MPTALAKKSDGLPPRWTQLDPYAEQQRLWESEARYKIVPAGRRSGKTELAKRFIVLAALTFTDYPDGLFICAAPTHAQAKRIFWKDLLALIPKQYVKSISKTDLTISLINGSSIMVLGMDKPERAEGLPIDGIVMDEYANMQADAWPKHVFPGLQTLNRKGWAWLIGVPEGRNHYYKTYQDACSEGSGDEWDGFTWKSSMIIPEKDIQAYRKVLDQLTFEQEFEASFVTFAGQAYYSFDRERNCVKGLTEDVYNPQLDLALAFDFNIRPGVAYVIQEDAEKDVTYVLDEFYIPKDSNTKRICLAIIKSEWAEHLGQVWLYGDATGGAGGTAKNDGSDWDIIDALLGKRFGAHRLGSRVPAGNPRERIRVNAMNSRLLSASGRSRLLIDLERCPFLIADCEGVVSLDDGSIDKKADPALTHATDGVGYYVVTEHPIGSQLMEVWQI